VGAVIWWLRRDLRLGDNQALAEALKHGTCVVPTFVLDPVLLASSYVGDKRVAFLFDGLRALDADLRTRGSYLTVRSGHMVTALAALMRETGAETVCAERDISPYATRRDADVAGALPLQLTGGLTLHPPEVVRKADGDPYAVYTPYSRAWRALPMPDAAELINAPYEIPTPAGILSEPMPAPVRRDHHSVVPQHFPAGEAEARRRLRTFAQAAIYTYGEVRDRMDIDGTSALSPYLRFGMISARHAIVTALEAIEAVGEGKRQGSSAGTGAETWLNELIWREFYVSILANFPEVRQHSFREAYRDLRWHNDRQAFAAWQNGRTGYPIVDAGMRQLLATGWMHNRARMIVASFLTKDLLVDWRWGERHFMQHLIDGDPAANNGGWQWTAGTGTDAAPYFRIFNPVTQGERYDPQGTYIRRWVPELAHVSDAAIHRPWLMSHEAQRQAACIIGADYPAPIVDHAMARERALAAYAQARESAHSSAEVGS
jgi:deoxyribodipyrimidine photo-lyase